MSFKKEKINTSFLLDTGVENIFITEYMASAPGDFVKVYLFALMYAEQGAELSNEKIARYLVMDVEDVRKAWNYWEKLGVIRKIKKTPEDKYEYDVEFVLLKEQLYGDKNTRKTYSTDSNTETMMEDKEIKDMFVAVQKVTGRVISGSEIMEVLSWITDFDAAPEIIMYAYSYCAKAKKTDIKYIEAVVKDWSSRGLRNAADVEEFLSDNEKKQYLYKRIFRALGFSRNSTEEERRIMDTWFETMEFTVDTVLEACRKTSGITNPNINYVNKVLTAWYEDKKKGLPVGRNASTGKESLTTAEVMQYYEMLQRKNARDAAERREQVYSLVPQIKALEDEQTSLSAEMSRMIISDRVDRKEAMKELKAKMDSINMEKAFLLTDNGFEIDYMDIKHLCPECKDTGILETGERCRCFAEVTKEKINMINRQEAK